tara:strand:+ start:1119 stop:1733 length:615 start_codon:yes stop_codon:yes gene_type:complete
MITNVIEFPKPQGLKCNMMPFIQGDSSSLPKEFESYSKVINDNFLEKGEIGFLTIDESFVNVGQSQRGYNSKGIDRNVHIEVGRVNSKNRWGSGGGSSWGGKDNTLLDDTTQVLIANNISNSCRYWDVIEKSYTKDGDLSEYIDKYPKHTGKLMKKGEVAKISIFTPHECVSQKESADRQFFRIVGKGVKGREPYFTVNPLVKC